MGGVSWSSSAVVGMGFVRQVVVDVATAATVTSL